MGKCAWGRSVNNECGNALSIRDVKKIRSKLSNNIVNKLAIYKSYDNGVIKNKPYNDMFHLTLFI